jgi:hypothetical protein
MKLRIAVTLLLLWALLLAFYAGRTSGYNAGWWQGWKERAAVMR